MLAGLLARMVVFPAGPLVPVPLGGRLGASAVAFAIFLVTGRGVFWGVAGGVLSVAALVYLRG